MSTLESAPERQPNIESNPQTLESEVALTKQEIEKFGKLPKKEREKQKDEQLAKLKELQEKLDQAIQEAIKTGDLEEAKRLKEQLENEMRDIEEKFDPSLIRIQELRDAMEREKKNAPWGALTRFLDQIDSVEEFEKIIPILKDSNEDQNVDFYLENLNRWKDPRLPEGFQKKFPLLASRLDTPQKIRIFLRGADFRDVDPMIMGDVFEDIIRKHEVNGEKVVRYRRYRGDKWCDALRIVYHTELQAWTLEEIALGRAASGVSSNDGLFIDFRTKEEREAEGDL